MIMGVECVPELKIGLVQIGIYKENHRRVETLEVMTVQANGFDQRRGSWSITQRTYRDLHASRDRLRWRDEHPRRLPSRYRSRKHRREDGSQL